MKTSSTNFPFRPVVHPYYRVSLPSVTARGRVSQVSRWLYVSRYSKQNLSQEESLYINFLFKYVVTKRINFSFLLDQKCSDSILFFEQVDQNRYGFVTLKVWCSETLIFPLPYFVLEVFKRRTRVWGHGSVVEVLGPSAPCSWVTRSQRLDALPGWSGPGRLQRLDLKRDVSG